MLDRPAVSPFLGSFQRRDGEPKNRATHRVLARNNFAVVVAHRLRFAFAPNVARLSTTEMEDRHRRRRNFGSLHSLGSDEHSLSRPRTLSRIAGRDQRWPIGFRVCAGRGPFHLHEYLDARLAGGRIKFPLPLRRFRQLKFVWETSTLHFDDKLLPRKDQNVKSPSEIEITVKPSGLVILQPARAEQTVA